MMRRVAAGATLPVMVMPTVREIYPTRPGISWWVPKQAPSSLKEPPTTSPPPQR